ncbi:hypothetical protein Lal_00040364 [Lupinus albus]|nr:hypothetical protein Lal_00040364 [Lupinus albus]
MFLGSTIDYYARVTDHHVLGYLKNSISKDSFFQDPIDLDFKHLNDQLAAPTNVLISVQHGLERSQFHVYSSSSSNMPTNHMIMDKLVSLRGYIATMIYALNDQNKQLHDKLRRLSNRLDYMDINVDSDQSGSYVKKGKS